MQQNNINFGTDGWRGIIADTFTFQNVKIVSKAIANYLKKHKKIDKGIVIGYDTRFLSENFAKVAAEIFSAEEIPVFITNTYTPTPVITFFVKHKKLNAGIAITSSHNPPEFLGIKYKPDYGGSAQNQETQSIEEEIKKINYCDIKKIPYEIGVNKKIIKIVNPYKDYLNYLEKIIDFKKIKSAKLSVIIDPMYGATKEYFGKILEEAGCKVVNISPNRDVLFNNKLPEPILKNLGELKKYCSKEKRIGLALDGDGDRIGAFDEKGNFLSSHNIASLLLLYLRRYKKLDGEVVKSINLTSCIDKIAEKENLKLNIVPVGFKYICEIMREKKVLLGAEESGGIAFYSSLPERDGILSSLYLLEMVANYKRPLQEIFKQLRKEFGNFYYYREDLKLQKENNKIYEYLKENKIEKINDIKVISCNELDGFKYCLENGDWIMIRISGTEPVLRVYAEAGTKKRLKNLFNWAKEKLLLNPNFSIRKIWVPRI